DHTATDSGRGLLLGRPAEVRVCEPRCGPVHQAGESDARGARTGDRRAPNRRQPSSHERLYLSARPPSRALVARCTAPAEAPGQRRGGLERRLPQLGPLGPQARAWYAELTEEPES